MPNYAQPLETIGRGTGATAGAAGGGFLGTLGELLEPLDWPRQALWNLIRSPYEAINQGSWEPLLGALPGAAGLLAGGPLGAFAGTVLAGGAQGLGKTIGGAAGTNAFEAPSVQDLTGTDDFATNLVAGMLTDPLTYAGGL